MIDVDKLALATVNASWRRKIDAATLASCLRGERPARDWAPHLATFFTELSPETLDRYLTAHGVPAEAALERYLAVSAITGEVNQRVEAWLRELANAAA